MKMLGGRLLARTLRGFGVDRLYSLPGHQILSVYDACPEEGIELISTRHEAAAVYMAEAQALNSRDIGVVLLAGGPELTNALTGLARAYYNNLPLVVISGCNTLAKNDMGFPQDFDQLPVVRPFTRWARRCYDPLRIPEYLEMAFREAIRDRPGPTYLEIPYDVLETQLDQRGVHDPERPERLRPVPTPQDLERAAALLARAERPLVIAGSGAFWSQAEGELETLIRGTRMPLLTIAASLALPFPPELVLGYGSPGLGRVSLRAIAEADTLLLLGTRMNFTLGFGNPPFLSEKQRIIQVDIDASSMGTNRPVEVMLPGDVKATLSALNDMGLSLTTPEDWLKELERIKGKFEQELEPLRKSPDQPIHPLRLVAEIDAALGDRDRVVLDGANSLLWGLQGLRPRPEGGILLSSMGDLQAIGAGLPYALATAAEDPSRRVLLHTGDGSVGYHLMEIETAIRHGIPFVVVIHNDQGWGMTRDMQQEYFQGAGAPANELGLVRYERMVEALGGYGELVEEPEAIGPALERALNYEGPACLNVLVDPEPKSPGLMMFMLLEVMLGKQTYYDKVPDWIHRLGAIGMDEPARKIMLKFLERQLHSQMG